METGTRVPVSMPGIETGTPVGTRFNRPTCRNDRRRQVWLIPIADERVGVQVKLSDPLRTRAIHERSARTFGYLKHWVPGVLNNRKSEH